MGIGVGVKIFYPTLTAKNVICRYVFVYLFLLTPCLNSNYVKELCWKLRFVAKVEVRVKFRGHF